MACFDGILTTKAGLILVRDLADPDRMRRLGVAGLVRFVGRRGVQLRRPKAEQLLEAARSRATRLPGPDRVPVAALLAADVALLDVLGVEIDRAEAALAEVLSSTPAGVLTSLPGIGTVRASSYGAAIGDPERFPDAAAAYRASGLVPAEYSSAGRSRGGQHISREGSVELRSAIIELGRGLAGHDPDFAAYRRRLRSNGKRPMVAAVVVGHRAHRRRVRHAPHPTALRPEPMGRRGGGRTRHGEDRRPAHQNDVTRPPASTMTGAEAANNPSPPGELDGRGRDRRRPGYAAPQGDCAPSKTPRPSQRASAHVVA